MYLIFLIFLWGVASVEDASPSPKPSIESADCADKITQTISLEDAQARTLTRNPTLKAAAQDVEAAEGTIRQARMRPNPELSIDFENVGGSNEFKDFELAEETLELSQRIELGGKRAARIDIAKQERALARLAYRSVKLDLLAETKAAFFDVLAEQEKVRLAREIQTVSEQVFATVAARVDAGKVAAMERSRATVLLANVRLRVEEAQRCLDEAMRRLTALWGSPRIDGIRVVGDLFDTPSLPPEETLRAHMIQKNPDLLRLAAELEVRRSISRFNQNLRVPDLTVKGGTRRFRDTGDHAFVFGLSVALPLFDRNQGAILQAQRAVTKAEQEGYARRRDIDTAFVRAYRCAEVALAKTRVFRETILPASKHAFEAAAEGFRRGKFPYIELLDAQRSLFEQQEHYVQAVAEFHRSRIRVERLVGGLAGSKHEVGQGGAS